MRLFVAGDLSQDQIGRLAPKVDEARITASFEAIRWIPEQNWHATLAFLGDREEAELDAILATVDAAWSHRGSLDYRPYRIQAMPHRSQPRLLALRANAGVGLQEFYFRLNQALGIRDRHRTFQFHVTVARFRELRGDDARALTDAIRDLSSLEGEEWTLPSITLFQSELSQAGANYRALKTWLVTE